MTRQRVKAGEVFAVPLPDGEVAICRVLYTSSYFRNVMLIAVHGATADDSHYQQQIANPAVTHFYCSSESFAKGNWRLLASTAVTAEDRATSKRIVAGDVWIEDQHMGPAGVADAGLPQMDVYGERILSRKLHDLLLA